MESAKIHELMVNYNTKLQVGYKYSTVERRAKTLKIDDFPTTISGSFDNELFSFNFSNQMRKELLHQRKCSILQLRN